MDTFALLLYCCICLWILKVAQAGVMIKHQADPIDDEDADLIVDLLERLVSATKMKSQNDLTAKEPFEIKYNNFSRNVDELISQGHYKKARNSNVDRRRWWSWCARCRIGTKLLRPKIKTPINTIKSPRNLKTNTPP